MESDSDQILLLLENVNDHNILLVNLGPGTSCPHGRLGKWLRSLPIVFQLDDSHSIGAGVKLAPPLPPRVLYLAFVNVQSLEQPPRILVVLSS